MNELKAEKKRFIENVSWLFVAKSVPSAVNFLEVIVLARILGLEGFGLLALVIAYVRIFNSLLDVRVWESTVKYVVEFLEKKEPDRALSMIKFSYLIDISTGLLAFLGSVALAGVANDVLIKSPDGFKLVLIFSFSLLLLTANATSMALFRVFDKFRMITLVESCESVFKLILLIAALYLGYGIKGVLLVYVVVSFFKFALAQMLVNRTLREKGLDGWLSSKISLLYPRIREITWFLLNTGFTSTLTIVQEGRIAVLILGYFFDAAAVSLYQVARSVIKVISKTVEPVYEVIFPRLASFSAGQQYNKFAELFKYVMANLLKFVIPIFILIFLFAEQLIIFIFSDQYLPASNTMRVITAACIFMGTGLATFLTTSLLALGRPGTRTAIAFFYLMTYFVLLLVLVPLYSHLGAGIALLIVEMLNFLFSGYMMYRLSRKYLR